MADTFDGDAAVWFVTHVPSAVVPVAGRHDVERVVPVFEQRSRRCGGTGPGRLALQSRGEVEKRGERRLDLFTGLDQQNADALLRDDRLLPVSSRSAGASCA